MCASSNSNSRKLQFWNTPKPLFNPWRRVPRPCLPRYGINSEKANHFGRFDDYLECNKNLDWSEKHVALDASPFVVSLISHTGAQRLFICSGTIVNSYGVDDEFYSTILTSATLIRCPEEDNAIANDIKVTVYLQDGSLFEGEILGHDFHFNFAAIQIKSGVKLKAAVIGNVDDYTKCVVRTDHSLRFQLAPHLDASEFIKLCPGMEVIALGRYHNDPYHIMAAPGKLMFEDSELDCEELLIASSEITKNGIGGPLITYNGCVIGLNFYKPARTPFLPINIVLKCLEHLLKYREVPRPWLGLEISDLDRAKLGELEKLRLSCPDTLSGILVRKVEQRSPASDAGICTDDVIVQIDDKDVGSSLKIKPGFIIPDQVTRAVIRYHSRRVTCLEFHPTNNNILLSGDKKGQLGVWDYDRVYEKRVYTNIHSCLLNSMRFSSVNDGTIFGASSDGNISCTDLETGISESLMDLNPNGWQGPKAWRMLYGLDINSEKGLVLVADNFGFLYMLDTRTKGKVGEAVLIHKKGTKVVGLHCNPVQPDLLLSCGNDHFARLWDVRKLEAGASLGNLAHRRVVNSAYFSPHSGSKILTTAQDNRIRVWDSIFINMESPSREIVHSHDFNRHLTAFRAEWDPKDSSESLAVIGRYISENYNGVALHPIDFINVSTGQLVAELVDPNITTISPVNKLHPRDDVLASGSSRSLFIWRPKDKSEEVQQKDEKKTIVLCGKDDKKLKKKLGDESDESDDEMFKSKGKKMSKPKPISALKKAMR